MNEMVSADSEKVTITTYHDDLQLRVSQLHTGSESQSASMSRVKRIRVDVPCRSPYAANARHNDDLVQVQLKFIQRMHETVHQNTITAAWTPDVRHHLLSQILRKRMNNRSHSFLNHLHTLPNRFKYLHWSMRLLAQL